VIRIPVSGRVLINYLEGMVFYDRKFYHGIHQTGTNRLVFL